jgi:hypothetical protein
LPACGYAERSRPARFHLDGGRTASEKMQDEHHDTDDQEDVNDARGNVKSEEPEQPEND